MFSDAKIKKEYLPHQLETPFGLPSGKINLIDWNGATFFCFSRHGDKESLQPNDIPYLANAFALKRLGVKYWLSVSLVTALKGTPRQGLLVVADDYTGTNCGRADQFFGKDSTPGLVFYVDNYSSSVSGVLKKALKDASESSGVTVLLNTENDP